MSASLSSELVAERPFVPRVQFCSDTRLAYKCTNKSARIVTIRIKCNISIDTKTIQKMKVISVAGCVMLDQEQAINNNTITNDTANTMLKSADIQNMLRPLADIDQTDR